MPQVALITREIPEPNMAGHLGYMYAILNHLQRQGYQVTIIVISGYLGFRRRDYTKHYRPGFTRIVGRDIIWLAGRVWVISNLIAPLDRWKNRALRLIGRTAGKQINHKEPFDESVGEFPNEVEARHAGRLVDECRPDFAFFDTIFLTKVLDFINVRTKSIVLTHDVFHRRYNSLVARGYHVAPKGFSREMESTLAARFDTIVAIQPEETALFRELAPSKEVITIGMPALSTPTDPKERVAGRFIFVGSEGLTNADGLRWFIDRIWPMTKQAVPHAELHVYGGVCNMLTDIDFAGVVLHGFTSDLTLAYQRATIALAPLKAGSGLKIKVLEYLSFGLPCVSTSLGVAGLDCSVDPPFLVADGEEKFASYTIRLCTDSLLLKELQRRTESYVRNYGPDRVFCELDCYLMRERGIARAINPSQLS